MQHCKYPSNKNTRGGGTCQQQNVQTGKRQECKWCDWTPTHDKEQCLAHNTTCHKCHNIISKKHIIVKVDFVTNAQQQIITQYQQLFTGLGCRRDPYMIRLKPDV